MNLGATSLKGSSTLGTFSLEPTTLETRNSSAKYTKSLGIVELFERAVVVEVLLAFEDLKIMK